MGVLKESMWTSARADDWVRGQSVFSGMDPTPVDKSAAFFATWKRSTLRITAVTATSVDESAALSLVTYRLSTVLSTRCVVRLTPTWPRRILVGSAET